MQRFLISGCQRSGTTLLRLVLNSHPDIECFDEGLGYDVLIKEVNGEAAELVIDEAVRLTGFKVPRFTEQLLWDEFYDLDYGRFPSFYKGEKVVHVVRNVLDVVGSMIRLKVPGGVSWIDRYGRSILQAMIEQPNISSKYKEKYKALNKNSLPVHLVGALYWMIKNQGMIDLLDHERPVIAVEYEALVESPMNELAKICEFLDVEWDDIIMHHHEQSHSELDDQGYAIGETDARRSIDLQSVGSYVNYLTDNQIQDVSSFVEIFSQEFKC